MINFTFLVFLPCSLPCSLPCLLPHRPLQVLGLPRYGAQPLSLPSAPSRCKMTWCTCAGVKQGLHRAAEPSCVLHAQQLEVGRVSVGGKIDYGWNRAHFGAWCVVSAPLILGLDLTQSALVAPFVDVITNQEAIAVNQVV